MEKVITVFVYGKNALQLEARINDFHAVTDGEVDFKIVNMSYVPLGAHGVDGMGCYITYSRRV